MAGVEPPLGELGVELLGDPGDESCGPGDVRLLEAGDVPVQQGQIGVRLLAAHGGVLHEHLLLQEETHKHRADEIPIEFGAAGEILLGLLQKLPQILPFVLAELEVHLLEVLPQVHALAVDLELLLRLRPAAGQLLRLRPVLLPEGVPALHTDKEAVKGPVKGALLLLGLGVDRPQGGLHHLTVLKPEGLQDFAGVRRLLGAHRQPLLPQEGGELRQFFQVDKSGGAHHRPSARCWACWILSVSSLCSAGAVWSWWQWPQCW